MRVEWWGLPFNTGTQPVWFGRHKDCTVRTRASDLEVPNRLGLIHLIEGDPAVSNMHSTRTFDVTAPSGVTSTVCPDGSQRLRPGVSTVRIPSSTHHYDIRITVASAERRSSVQPLLPSGERTRVVDAPPPWTPTDAQLRDLVAVFEPTLRSGDFSVIAPAEWSDAAKRRNTSISTLKGRVLRTIAAQAEDHGCPKVEGPQSRQILGRWLVTHRVLLVSDLGRLE